MQEAYLEQKESRHPQGGGEADEVIREETLKKELAIIPIAGRAATPAQVGESLARKT